jgi:hypothetical protein
MTTNPFAQKKQHQNEFIQALKYEFRVAKIDNNDEKKKLLHDLTAFCGGKQSMVRR